MTALSNALATIDWAGNVSTALTFDKADEKISAAALRVAIWSNQLEILEKGNPALSFIREMQIAAQQCGALIGLCLYKPSAASARTLLETALYYSFFRDHPVELATLATDPKYYISKTEIVEYHKMHTPSFRVCQAAFGLVGKLEAWYSKVSAIVHGQVPGAWNAHSNLSDLSFSEETHLLALDTMLVGEQLLHEWFLCTVGKSLWGGFAPDAKVALLKGIPGQVKTIIGLDSK